MERGFDISYGRRLIFNEQTIVYFWFMSDVSSVKGLFSGGKRGFPLWKATSRCGRDVFVEDLTMQLMIIIDKSKVKPQWMSRALRASSVGFRVAKSEYRSRTRFPDIEEPDFRGHMLRFICLYSSTFIAQIQKYPP